MSKDQIIDDQSSSSVVKCCPAQQPKQRQGRLITFAAGFTLVELLTVVAIIGVLAMLVLPSYTVFVTRAQNGRAKSEVRLLEIEINGYLMETGSLPASLADIKRDDLLDPWENTYVYSNPPTRKRFGLDINDDFDLYSLGADRASPLDGSVAEGTGKDDVLRGANGTFIGLALDW